MEKGKYYISTAIAYTSSKPHIGNTYEIVMADVIARYKRMMGYDVYFQTGTDEHGQKIEDKAREAGVKPQKYVDEIATEIKRIWDMMDTSYDAFVRTTDKKHERVVQKIFKKLYDQGDIYKGEYNGLYCKPCESFFTSSQLVDGKCPDCGRSVDEACEEAYFLKLSKYQDRLKKYIEDHPNFIEPLARKNEMMNNFLNVGLQDLCISRTSFKWGIPVDFDSKHVVYVWLDALVNYITFIGYDPDGSKEKFYKYWPANLHLIGKDILRFHTLYWPIILMALDLELPQKIFGHPWLLMNNDKMSKSKGNVIFADELVDLFGADAVRYYLVHEIPYSSDGNITYDLVIDRINGDLANILGNLVQRTISMARKYFSGEIVDKNIVTDLEENFIKEINQLEHKIELKMEKLEIAQAIEEIFIVLRLSNKYIDETMPWVLAKDESKKEQLEQVIYNLLEAIRVCATFLECAMPSTAQKIFKQLNCDDNSRNYNRNNAYHVNEPSILFGRIDKEKIFVDKQ